jgi:phosphopantothenoylcysteine decarboxylase/phosphopantothenate--cysteine ligase
VSRLTNKRILLGITGGIAAYKSAELTRRLQDEGADVRVVMTTGACEFITPLTMQALSGHPVHRDLLDSETESVMGHIELARWADIIVIAPATADFIARLAAGRGDDLLTAICLAANCEIAVAPAMNHAMWDKPATQDNVLALQSAGHKILAPGSGLQACGETGEGRLMDVPDLVTAIAERFHQGALAGNHIVITAGPTREAIDPVRYISNHSSGKQGFALAEAAAEAGAKVTLVAGPVSLETPAHVQRINIESAEQMLTAVLAAITDADIFVGVAAVSDYKPATAANSKIKKTGDTGMNLQLVQNPDILRAVAETDPQLFVVGFAAETDNLIENAKTKLEKKNLDMIVANDVSDTSIGFSSDENQTTIITQQCIEAWPRMSKEAVSRKLIEQIAVQMKNRV